MTSTPFPERSVAYLIRWSGNSGFVPFSALTLPQPWPNLSYELLAKI